MSGRLRGSARDGLDDWSAPEHETGKEGSPPGWKPAYLDDVWFYRGVMAVLGLVALACAVGLIGIAWQGKDVPDGLVALGSASIGALAGAIVGGRHG